MAKKDEDITGWITVGGKHIPLGAGESKEDAINKAFNDKERQIAQNKKEADRKNAEEKAKQFDTKAMSDKEKQQFNKAMDESKKNTGYHTVQGKDKAREIIKTLKPGQTLKVSAHGTNIGTYEVKQDGSVQGKNEKYKDVNEFAKKWDISDSVKLSMEVHNPTINPKLLAIRNRNK